MRPTGKCIYWGKKEEKGNCICFDFCILHIGLTADGLMLMQSLGHLLFPYYLGCLRS